MQTQTIIISAVALGIGLIGGYLIGVDKGTLVVPQSDVHMSGMMTDMSAALRGKQGDALDEAFIDSMIVHHEGAVEMARILLGGTQRPELVKMGQDIISVQTTEIDMMKRWRMEWFGR